MAGNLEFIQSINISTSQSTTSVTNCFTSNYDVYEIYVAGVSTVGTSQTDLNMRLIDSGGSVISDSEYDYAHLIMRTDTSFTEQRATSQAQFYRTFAQSTDQIPESQGAYVTVFNPNNSSSYTFIKYQSSAALAGLKIGIKGIGVHKSAEQITGFQLIDANGTRPYDTGKISVYGLASN